MQLRPAEQRLARQFGEYVRARRKALGYTPDDLAYMIGTNRRFISELERGKGTSYLGSTFPFSSKAPERRHPPRFQRRSPWISFFERYRTTLGK